MFQPPLRWIGDTSHHGALAMQLHLHCPHQLCHPSCIVMLVIIFMVVVLIMTLIRMRVGVTLICSTILILRTRPLPFIPIMAPIIPPFASQSAQPELGCKHKFNISCHKILKNISFHKIFWLKSESTHSVAFEQSRPRSSCLTSSLSKLKEDRIRVIVIMGLLT